MSSFLPKFKKQMLHNPSDRNQSTYRASVKSDVSDELINTYLLRPIAHLFVRLVYRTPITPNQVTMASIAVGIVAAAVYGAAAIYRAADPFLVPVAGLCVTVKDLLDSADGQLARAKAMYSRTGRFLDSLGDIFVNFVVFGAISLVLYRSTGSSWYFLAGIAGFLGISLRVSYHVFYQTSFLHLQSAYEFNRISEEIQRKDLEGDPGALRLQRMFLFFYGWQDELMKRIDQWSSDGVPPSQVNQWYGDRLALRLSGFLGLGTELFALMLCSVANRLDFYLAVNIIGFNLLWGSCILYRRRVLARHLQNRQRAV
jgi:phosphatidylglycerophosphate synthase